MQREEPEGIIIVCDFCRRDWDGQSPMIEGHHGSIICLDCLKLALAQQKEGADKYKCTMCLRFNMPPTLKRYAPADHPDSIICHECIVQAAKAFSRNPDVPWQWDGAGIT